MNPVESLINDAVQWLRLAVETMGVCIIALGVLVAIYGVVRALLLRQNNFNPVRLQLARYLALGLEFQLGADILSTAIAPNWDEIGKLAAIDVPEGGTLDMAAAAVAYAHLFWLLMWIGLGCALLAFIAAPLLKRMMHGVR